MSIVMFRTDQITDGDTFIMNSLSFVIFFVNCIQMGGILSISHIDDMSNAFALKPGQILNIQDTSNVEVVLYLITFLRLKLEIVIFPTLKANKNLPKC